MLRAAVGVDTWYTLHSTHNQNYQFHFVHCRCPSLLLLTVSVATVTEISDLHVTFGTREKEDKLVPFQDRSSSHKGAIYSS